MNVYRKNVCTTLVIVGRSVICIHRRILHQLSLISRVSAWCIYHGPESQWCCYHGGRWHCVSTPENLYEPIDVVMVWCMCIISFCIFSTAISSLIDWQCVVYQTNCGCNAKSKYYREGGPVSYVDKPENTIRVIAISTVCNEPAGQIGE